MYSIQKIYAYLTTLSAARISWRVFLGWLTTCEFYKVDIRDKELATAYFEGFSRLELERAVENEETLRIIVVLSDKSVGHLLYRVRCVTG